MKARKTYEQILAEQKAGQREPLEDVLFRGNVVDKVVTCKGCATRNRVAAGRGAASCAGCGVPLGVGTPRIHGLPDWIPRPAHAVSSAAAFGTDRTISPEDLDRPPPPPRSLWTHIADAWSAAWRAWKDVS